MTITVVGAGYVGLVTAAVFSDLGNKVFCLDFDAKRIENLKRGKLPFFEPQLDDYLSKNFSQKRLFFTTSYSESVPKSQIILVCVGTPPKENGEANLTYLFNAVEETAKHLSGYTLIAIKSTIPIGFEDEIESAAKKFAKTRFEFASCPEFLREGTAIEDTLHPDRIVIGTSSKKAQKVLLELHAPLGGERIICDTRSAQLIKYASNALLATKISFANAIANICEKTGADVEKVLSGVGADKRLGRSFLYPGVGYGGSCLPKDVLAFAAVGDHFNYNFDLLKTVHRINESQIDFFLNKIKSAFKNKSLVSKKIGILGLSFKPNTDDIREAPAIKIIKRLIQEGAEVTAFDPKANENAKQEIPEVIIAKDEYETAKQKDCLLLLTEWPQFIQMDYEKVKTIMASPILFDGRNALHKEKLESMGFKYIGVGR
ncbi:UDP-glucose/GDP-mannose dehydrogenase family protein [Candidatus Curtissbacteria bacterium]|nr:UDP-glucose/GDP-mannose dehydrogenase family protein [Candidatus Curtissbacteria bacterium]